MTLCHNVKNRSKPIASSTATNHSIGDSYQKIETARKPKTPRNGGGSLARVTSSHCETKGRKWGPPYRTYPWSIALARRRLAGGPLLCHTASYCIILHHAVSYCIILYHTASYCIILHHTVSYTAPYCIILHHNVSYCIILHHTVSYSIIQYHTVSYCIILYHTVKLKVRDTECPLQVCQLSRSSESTHFRSFVEM